MRPSRRSGASPADIDDCGPGRGARLASWSEQSGDASIGTLPNLWRSPCLKGLVKPLQPGDRADDHARVGGRGGFEAVNPCEVDDDVVDLDHGVGVRPSLSVGAREPEGT